MRSQNIFTPKRKMSYLKGFSMFGVLILLLLLGLFMNQPGGPIVDSDIKINANAPADDTGDPKQQKNNVLMNDGKAYYLLKEEEGRVELYYFDEEGEKNLIRTTDIPFTLISEQDQIQFSNGIKIENEVDLDNILQDFES
ncbi:MAG: hypothetical protein PHW03_05160 [Eubacteriales bacterium]|nr:hypothetical protein [Eubacteriales bacterium]MDD4390174.1 hypothetical protein [Eubacteriales bacterium]